MENLFLETLAYVVGKYISVQLKTQLEKTQEDHFQLVLAARVAVTEVVLSHQVVNGAR